MLYLLKEMQASALCKIILTGDPCMPSLPWIFLSIHLLLALYLCYIFLMHEAKNHILRLSNWVVEIHENRSLEANEKVLGIKKLSRSLEVQLLWQEAHLHCYRYDPAELEFCKTLTISPNPINKEAMIYF